MHKVYENSRLEREGGPPDLPKAFSRFVLERLRGRSLDDQHAIESAAGKFPDFGCFRDLVLFEVKHFEKDQNERINSVINEKVSSNERPFFFGSRDGQLIMDKINNSEEVVAAIFAKLTKTIERQLSKSCKQFVSYRQRHPRKNTVNICVLLNSQLMEYTPEIVGKAIHSKMKLNQIGPPKFQEIDAVLYISEKHFLRAPDGRIAHPITIYEGMGLDINGWKVPILNRIVRSWSNFRSGETNLQELQGTLPPVGTIEDVPDKLSRSDFWLLEYARNPYLRDFSVTQLRVHFHRLMALTSLTFLIGSWPKPKDCETERHLRMFQHTIAETNRRGIDLRELNHDLLTPQDRAVVYDGMPEELIAALNN